jgi:hypothetical protein
VPLEQLSLGSLVPSAGREGVSLLMDYQHWRQQRGIAARSRVQPIKAIIVAARYLYHEKSSVSDSQRCGFSKAFLLPIWKYISSSAVVLLLHMTAPTHISDLQHSLHCCCCAPWRSLQPSHHTETWV